MKTRLAFLVVGLLMLAGCNGLTAQNQTDLAASVAEFKAAVVASTQPYIVTPATATQPAVVIQPSPQVVKIANQVLPVVEKAQPIINAATQPNATIGEVVQSSAPLFGPYAYWVILAGSLATMAQKWWSANKANAAAKTLGDGIKAAIDTKAITVTANAPAIVNAAATDHPVNNAVIDMLSDASTTPRIV